MVGTLIGDNEAAMPNSAMAKLVSLVVTVIVVIDSPGPAKNPNPFAPEDPLTLIGPEVAPELVVAVIVITAN